MHVWCAEFNSQQSAFNRITDYEGVGTLDGVGPLLCTLCLFVWIISIVQEGSATISVMAAVFELRGRKTEIVHSAETGKKRIKSVSYRRVAWFLGVQAARLAIALVLGYGMFPHTNVKIHTSVHACLYACLGGARYLARTIDLESVLLNSLALEESCFMHENKMH